TLYRQVGALVRERIEPKRKVDEDWFADFDSGHGYPVDFRMNGALPPRHLFYVSSQNKSDIVASVVHYLASRDIKVPSLAVVDPKLELGVERQNRLEEAVSTIIRGVDGNEDDITEFALAEPDSSGIPSSRH